VKDPSHMAGRPRPLICLVTDRQRLHAASSGAGDPTHLVVEQVRDAGRAGVDLIQVRERDLSARELAGLVEACLLVTAGTRARVLVNERADVALATGAAGVHLRGDSMKAARLRGIVPEGFLIGRSVHGIDEAASEAADGGLDYLVLGTVFASPSKAASHPLVGLSGLDQASKAVPLPVLGIGGIDVRRAAEVAGTGASGVAAIGLFIDPRDDRGCKLTLGEVVHAIRRAFDTPRSDCLP
jgi:thiamine-phosphate pyrophosphorylase